MAPVDWSILIGSLIELGETEVSIAAWLGVNQSSVSRWRRGRNSPRYDEGVALVELERMRARQRFEKAEAIEIRLKNGSIIKTSESKESFQGRRRGRLN